MARSHGTQGALTLSRSQARLASAYARMGERYFRVVLVCIFAIGALTTAFGSVGLGMFLHPSGPHLAEVALSLQGLNVVAALATWYFGLRPLSPSARAWMAGSRTDELAMQAWVEFSSRVTTMITRGVAIYSVVFLAVLPLASALLNVPGFGLAIVLVCVEAEIALAAALDLVVWDWSLRPVIVDVAHHLPADFKPGPDWGASLRIRVFSAPLLTTLFVGVMDAGFLTPVHARPIIRLAVAGVIAVGLVSSLGVATTAMTTRVVLEPIRSLVAAMRRVHDGDLDVIAPVTSTDELGELTSSFNAMVVGLREREALRAENEALGRLRRFLSPQIAEAVLTSGDATILTPHRREIAVLFCDLRGFTSFTSGAEPEEVVEALDDYFRAVGEVLHRFEATVGHFAGDGIMAYLNDPFPCEDPPRSAVEMALALQIPMRELVDRWKRRGHDLGYGVGVAYGYATLGTIGFEGRSDYTALGAVVNLAARLCGEAGNDEVLIDSRTAASLDGAYRLAEREAVLKGLPSPIRVHQVLGPASRS